MVNYGTKAAPISEEKCIIRGCLRISVITNRIIRVERASNYEEVLKAEGDLPVQPVFEDRSTQKVVNRDFGNPKFSLKEDSGRLTIKTSACEFIVEVDSNCVAVEMNGVIINPWKVNYIGGTCRTLDRARGDRIYFGKEDGPVKLEDSLFSEEGVAVIDDSRSMLLAESGELIDRDSKAVDVYYLAFGKDFIGGLKEFYGLTGPTPLLPKYALGNWWSRYHAYKQDEYIALMDKFAEKNIPLTVATIDMDWHLVKNLPKDVTTIDKVWGKGWTGYTFDKDNFPDYKQFFKDLKARNMAITMNLHPHDGIRYYEDQYVKMARAMGIDPVTKKTVEFDFCDLKFVKNYFNLVLHPYEKDGVDFWWIDWQQGTDIKGHDQLWPLNHYHTIDAGRDGRTAMILSRYAGTGSHRYPLGFSGDTIVSFKSLRYQPEFTNDSVAAGFNWWSHDIGGHMMSHGDRELYIRWLEYGCFSPINRMHSANDKWSKEPWLYGKKAERIATRFLRLRHKLLPYIYTCNVMTATEGLPIVMPMYFLHDCKEAYECKTQYYFGPSMIVSPVVNKMNRDGLSPVSVWLPDGIWYDFFTHEKYEGGRTYELMVPIERIPVFVKAGSIIPMLNDDLTNDQSFTDLEVLAFAGADGKFRMYDETGYIDFKISSDNFKNYRVTSRKFKGIITESIKTTIVG